MFIHKKSFVECATELKQFCLEWQADFWSFSELQNSSQTSTLRFYLCTMENALAAVGILKDDLDSSDLLFIFTKDEYRRNGFAENIIMSMVIDFQNIFLEVKSTNAPAIKLYEKLGFKHTLTRPRYYKTGEDAKVYCLSQF